jgi:branched-chain amino acid transport system substrate-binding protein
MKKAFARLAVAAVALVATPALAQIKIGLAGPMSVQYAAFGEQLRRDATMAVEDVNAAGGVNG